MTDKTLRDRVVDLAEWYEGKAACSGGETTATADVATDLRELLAESEWDCDCGTTMRYVHNAGCRKLFDPSNHGLTNSTLAFPSGVVDE